MEGVVTPDYMDHTAMCRRFEEAEQTTRPAREKAERDRDYYDGKQWTATETAALEKRGQPVVTYNRIQRKVNSLKGLETQTRKDPKAFPRTPGDDGAAQAATDALRYVCDDTNWDTIRSEAFENLIVEGTAAVLIGAKQAGNVIDPDITVIAWDRFYHDPHSRRADFRDASYMGIVTWMDEAEANRRWPDKRETIESTMAGTRASDTYDDRPKEGLWADPKRKRVRVNEEFYLADGTWVTCKYTGGGFLEEPAPSPYHDQNGKPDNAIRAISAYVDRDNNRYGEVRAMISPQDEVNKRRSKGLHRSSTRQARVSRAAQLEPSALKRELAKPDGVIVADDGEFEILENNDLAVAEFNLLQEAKNELDLISANSALQGKNEKDLSGRAILAQQQGGMVELAQLMDRLRQLSLAVYRAVWARVRQFWKEPRWIRVTDDPRAPRFVGLNQPRTMLQVAQERLQGDPQAEMKLALLARDPAAHQVMDVQNNVGEIDIDITIDEGMDTPTVQSEQFDMLLKTLPALQGQPPKVMELIIQSSSLRDKDKLIEIAREVGAQPQIPPELQRQIEEGQKRVQEQDQEIQRLKTDTTAEVAKAQAKAQTDIEVARIDADTRIEVARIQAEADAQIAQQRAAAEARRAENEPEPAAKAA